MDPAPLAIEEVYRNKFRDFPEARASIATTSFRSAFTIRNDCIRTSDICRLPNSRTTPHNGAISQLVWQVRGLCPGDPGI
jgi:hypothetical protein